MLAAELALTQQVALDALTTLLAQSRMHARWRLTAGDYQPLVLRRLVVGAGRRTRLRWSTIAGAVKTPLHRLQQPLYFHALLHGVVFVLLRSALVVSRHDAECQQQGSL